MRKEFERVTPESVGIRSKAIICLLYTSTRAKQMLAAGGRNVSEIAASVGFDNFSYFSTLFKKYVDCPPSEYMRKNE